MTEPSHSTSRKRPPRKTSGGAGQVMLGVVIALGVAGTGMWVFSDDKRWGLVSLILLVWGLVIAAFLVARNARDLRTAETKEGNLKAVYELQLEREISARREYELQLERDVRADLRAESNQELTALKSEVLALRANLEELLGRELGPSYAELYAAAEQRAIAAQQQARTFVDDDHVRAQQDFAGVPEPTPDVDSYYGAGSAASEMAPPQAPLQAPLQTPSEAPRQPAPPPVGDAPTAVFAPVTEEPAADAAAADDAQPVDVEHVENFDRSQERRPSEPFVPLAPQSGYRSPYPPRRYAPLTEPPVTPAAPDDRVSSGATAWRNAFDEPVSEAPEAEPASEAPEAEPPLDSAPAEPEDAADSTRGQHTSGNTVADLIARMNADTERTPGGRRRKTD